MKKIASIIIICMMLMSLCNVCYAATFQPVINAESGNVGDTITVTVSIPANTNASGGSFNLVYDNTKMELVDATAGNLLAGFSKTVNKTYAVNKVRMNFTSTETLSASGGIALTATFRLTASGTATFSTEKFKLVDIDTNYLECADSEESISITDGGSDITAFTPAISAENGNVGNTITVTVSIPANTNASGGSFNLVYDNTKMELVDAVAGNLLAGFSKTVNKDYAVNTIRLNFAGSETISASGGVALTVTFKLTGEGNATFKTEKFKLVDIDTNYLACEDSEESISITDGGSDIIAFTPVISAENGNAGDTITVTVSIPANTNASGGSFNLVYDNTKMEIVEATAGNLLTGFSKTVNKDYAVNTIRFNFAGSETISASGGVALTVTFKLTGEGTATFKTEEFKLVDIDTNYLECADSEKKITITGSKYSIKVNSVNGFSINVSLSGENKTGVVCARLSSDKKAKEIKFYSIIEPIVINFDAPKYGDDVEIFWWKAPMAPVCESVEVRY